MRAGIREWDHDKMIERVGIVGVTVANSKTEAAMTRLGYHLRLEEL